MLAAAMIAGAGAAQLGTGAAAAATPGEPAAKNSGTFRLSVLGTTDTHGHVLNWDYFTDAEYDDKTHNDVGLAKLSTLISAVRAERGAATTLTLDAGDTIQGTPLSYYYAMIDPITGGHGHAAPRHPMAVAMNAIGYDAAALGNHEFNYGLPLLRRFAQQLQHPLLGANALDWRTGQPAFPSYVIKRVPAGDGTDIKVAIVGLVTPGCAIWDKANVHGKIKFQGIVEQARKLIPVVKGNGADIVIVSCHSGADTSSSYGTAIPFPENASTLLAEQVPDIDAILVGHAHVEIPQRYVTNLKTGRQVLLSEPLYWGMRLTVMDLNLARTSGQWRVASASSVLLNSNTVEADPRIVRLTADAHARVRSYVNGVVGESTASMSAATSRYEDTPAMDFINFVQATTVKQALAGTSSQSLPVLSLAAPFNAAAAIPAGTVSVRDVAGLYSYDNTLVGITFTGDQVAAYLEFSARYFQQVSGPGPFAPPDITNAVTPLAPRGTPDYNYDIMGGLDAPLTYDIDIARPVGSRIKNLAYDGTPVTAAQTFVIAINNYRQSGGGNYPGVATAPVVYNAQREIRQLIIEYVTATRTIDAARFSTTDWRLVANGQPVVVTAG